MWSHNWYQTVDLPAPLAGPALLPLDVHPTIDGDLWEKSIKQNMPYLDGCFVRKFNKVFLLELSNGRQCFGMMFSH